MNFVREDEKLFVVCVDGKEYEVLKSYMEPRITFAEWAATKGRASDNSENQT